MENDTRCFSLRNARRHGAEVQPEDDTSIASHVDNQCHFAKNLIICRKIWQFLPFHKLCIEKYEQLGLEFPLKDTPAIHPDTLKKLLVQL